MRTLAPELLDDAGTACREIHEFGPHSAGEEVIGPVRLCIGPEAGEDGVKLHGVASRWRDSGSALDETLLGSTGGRFIGKGECTADIGCSQTEVSSTLGDAHDRDAA